MADVLVELTGVTIDDVSVVLEEFNNRLKKSLDSPANRIILLLHPVMPATSELLDWLESWNGRIGTAEKQLVIVPSTPEQLQCLEFSHPEQGLSYVAGLSDVKGRAVPTDDVAVEECVNESVVVVRPPSVVAPTETVENVDVSFDKPPAPKVIIAVGTLSGVSGEYECNGCHTTRMWVKGEPLAVCENPECLDPKSGWHLVCDIF